jgi:hypothetical protein
MRPLGLVLSIFTLSASSCSRASDTPVKPGEGSRRLEDERTVVLEVAGMQRGKGGKT